MRSAIDELLVFIFFVATGMFGALLARHLGASEGLNLLLASRSQSRSQLLVDRLVEEGAKAKLTAVAVDTGDGLAGTLGALKPFIVIDCSGPFQGAGYDTPRAALQAGCHFIDLADARDYLSGFVKALEDTACTSGVTASAGASSTPALSGCVVSELVAAWRQVDAIDIVISPGGKSEVGRSVIEAIMSYAGRPVPVWRDGRLASTIGWVEAWTVDLPGLGNRRVAAVETLDAELLGAFHNVRKRVRFGAGLESAIEQYGVETIARLRSRNMIFNPVPFAGWLASARALIRITTSNRGGMIVAAEGRDADGAPVHRRWSLLAERGHGPYVPVMAAAAMVRKLMSGCCAPGARLALDDLQLAEVEAEMAPYAITTKIEPL